MAQQNFMSARALSMEEIENVNGGLSREAWYMFNKKECGRVPSELPSQLMRCYLMLLSNSVTDVSCMRM